MLSTTITSHQLVSKNMADAELYFFLHCTWSLISFSSARYDLLFLCWDVDSDLVQQEQLCSCFISSQSLVHQYSRLVSSPHYQCFRAEFWENFSSNTQDPEENTRTHAPLDKSLNNSRYWTHFSVSDLRTSVMRKLGDTRLLLLEMFIMLQSQSHVVECRCLKQSASDGSSSWLLSSESVALLLAPSLELWRPLAGSIWQCLSWWLVSITAVRTSLTDSHTYPQFPVDHDIWVATPIFSCFIWKIFETWKYFTKNTD